MALPVNLDIKQLKEQAEDCDPGAQFLIGMAYSLGMNVHIDLEVAVAYLRRAAQNGLKAAQFEMGKCYFLGSGVEKDYHQSYLWFRKAAENDHPIAHYQLGFMYANGLGTARDYGKSHRHIQVAARAVLAKAQTSIYDGHEIVGRKGGFTRIPENRHEVSENMLCKK